MTHFKKLQCCFHQRQRPFLFPSISAFLIPSSEEKNSLWRIFVMKESFCFRYKIIHFYCYAEGNGNTNTLLLSTIISHLTHSVIQFVLFFIMYRYNINAFHNLKKVSIIARLLKLTSLYIGDFSVIWRGMVTILVKKFPFLMFTVL